MKGKKISGLGMIRGNNIYFYRLCHYGVVRSLSWRQPSSNNLLQLASGGEDHSVRILNVEY
jgi:Ni,Fe-hydrogenase III large subunit